ncbi:Subtilase family protein [Riemerella columbipharyngis]|uniref:Subtilase family protein n=2 Tax=Riemerella columbipharyngis TaxID=1071918 RepID=A0A1G7APS4_9FLAO|nr:Subtilase family protein [Riemerella columbipharyngis]
MNGTSMATPNVTGTLLLIQEHFSKLNVENTIKVATLKAIVINTLHEAGDNPGPDYKSGWGLLNGFGAAKAINFIEK